MRLALLRFAKPNVAPGAFERMIETERGSRADHKLDSQLIRLALDEFASRGKDSEFLKELTPTQFDALTENKLKSVLGSVFTYRRSALYTGTRGAREVAAILTKAQPRRQFRKAPKSAAVKLLQTSRPRSCSSTARG